MSFVCQSKFLLGFLSIVLVELQLFDALPYVMMVDTVEKTKNEKYYHWQLVVKIWLRRCLYFYSVPYQINKNGYQWLSSIIASN